MTARGVALICVALAVVRNGAAQAERHCEESKTPGTLPAATTLLDSARAIADLTGREMPAAGVLFSLVYNDEDSLPDVLGLDSPSSAAAELLMPSLRPQHPTGYWAVRVRVIGGPVPTLSLTRSTYCPPVPRLVQARPRVFSVSLRVGDRSRAIGTDVRFTADAELSETGRVVEVVLIRPTGVREIDDNIRYYVAIRDFLPARLDETAIPSRLHVEGYTRKLSERLSDFGVEATYSLQMRP